MPEPVDLLMRRVDPARAPGKVHRVLAGERGWSAMTRCGEPTFDLHVVTRCLERELCARCEASWRAEEGRREASP